MGAGVLPVALHKNKLYCLFGKENKFEKSAPGFSDFGGGQNFDETFLETAIREACEETTGFLGSEKDIRTILMKTDQYHIDLNEKYRMFILPIKYEPMLEEYYNNNQKFIQSHLDETIIKNSKIFEKSEIRWVCIDDVLKMRSQFRFFFRDFLNVLISKKSDICKITKSVVQTKTRKNRK
jgi:8-oxo-dGTP pyrophosphatase MutT (NUDIX family)